MFLTDDLDPIFGCWPVLHLYRHLLSRPHLMNSVRYCVTMLAWWLTTSNELTSGNMEGALVFRPHLWSVYKRTLEGRNRTNNPVEGLNNRLRNLIGRKKPGFWVLVEKLQEEDRASTAKITKSFGAHSGEVADDDEDCLKAIVQKFDQMTTIEYLKSISNFVMTGETFLPDDDE